jgi:hypothetical protein
MKYGLVLWGWGRGQPVEEEVLVEVLPFVESSTRWFGALPRLAGLKYTFL